MFALQSIDNTTSNGSNVDYDMKITVDGTDFVNEKEDVLLQQPAGERKGYTIYRSFQLESGTSNKTIYFGMLDIHDTSFCSDDSNTPVIHSPVQMLIRGNCIK